MGSIVLRSPWFHDLSDFSASPLLLTSVIHSFTLGFSVSCKVLFSLLLQLSSKILQNKVGFGFLFSVFVCGFNCFKVSMVS